MDVLNIHRKRTLDYLMVLRIYVSTESDSQYT